MTPPEHLDDGSVFVLTHYLEIRARKDLYDMGQSPNSLRININVHDSTKYLNCFSAKQQTNTVIKSIVFKVTKTLAPWF